MPPTGRTSIALLFAVAALAAAPAGPLSARQSGIASERPAGLVVDFSAVESDGSPVAGLQPSEIEVRINGKPRIVRALRRITAAPARLAPGAAPRPASPYGTNASVVAGRSLALVVDEASFTAGREQLFRNAVEGLLAELTPADRTSIVVLPFGGVRLPFTSEVARIRTAITEVAGQGSRDETGSELACRTRRFLESLDGFLQNQAGRRSPLTVVLFTAGLAAPRRDAPMAVAPGMCELLVSDFQRITATAGTARASFYVMQPADIGMSGPIAREGIGGVGYLGSDNPLEGIEHFAGATGGTRLPLDASGTGSLLRVAMETSAHYLAELEPERGEVFGRSRSLSVRVARRGVTVRARPEMTFPVPPERLVAVRLAVPELLGSREPFTDLPLRAAGFTVRDASGQLRVGVVLEPVDPAAALESAGAILIDAGGRIAGRWFAAETLERPLMGAMAAEAGSYRLRVAAIDRAGRPGVAETDIDVGLTAVGPLSLGSMIVGISRDTGVRPKLEFGSEPTAIASFDIYGGEAGMRLSAAMDVARLADGPALTALPVTLTRVSEWRVVATGAVPLGALAPGDYVVRGAVRLDDGTAGRVVRTIRKAPR